jgi:hypothetical protein
LTPDTVRDLIVAGRTRLLSGFVDDQGQTFSARVVLGPGAVVELERSPPLARAPAWTTAADPAGPEGPDSP